MVEQAQKQVPWTLPNERLLFQGPSDLSDQELIETILNVGMTAHRAREAAFQLLTRFGNLQSLYTRSAREIADIAGCSLPTAASLVAAFALAQKLQFQPPDAPAFSSPKAIFDRYQSLANDTSEVVMVLSLNAQNRLLRQSTVARGSATSCVIRPREVFIPALREAAVSIVLLHSHPSGDPTPSREDVAFTERVARAGETLGVRLLDHVIIGLGSYASFAELGYMSDRSSANAS